MNLSLEIISSQDINDRKSEILFNFEKKVK